MYVRTSLVKLLWAKLFIYVIDTCILKFSFVTMKKPCLVYWEEPFENMLNIEYECGNWFMLLSVLAYNLEQINAEKARLL
jgi:hypothetical protein